MAPNTLLPTLAMLAAVFLWSSATPGSKFALTEIAVAEFLVSQAGRRIESLGDVPGHTKALPLFRLPRIDG
jgi:hypothetical protein